MGEKFNAELFAGGKPFGASLVFCWVKQRVTKVVADHSLWESVSGGEFFDFVLVIKPKVGELWGVATKEVAGSSEVLFPDTAKRRGVPTLFKRALFFHNGVTLSFFNPLRFPDLGLAR